MKILIIINAILCGAIALRLLTFRRAGLTYRPWAARLAYGLVLLSASVPIRVAFGGYTCIDITELPINAVLCAAVFAARGNVMDLLRPRRPANRADAAGTTQP
ncbi:phage holin family protein [Pandoraea sp.]|uniref:phage holin family protein n=1 Tax=Pandoraea sp. TaxID=1883445 RepID=UPI0011FE1721|nr:phage holin family protein [Pandoraea sp.]TAL53830.1 MAG: phage holin family protein [Pandoraea sp.]TAM17083.1 MAG: phage holin family protein [Pandoraea sp.]